MSDNYKVYISSTYEDLKEQRQAAARAIRRRNPKPFAMQEDLTASEQKSVDKCLADVRCCDIYIGIIAFRYGSIPEGYDKSITQLEYEAAGEAGIERLILIFDEDVQGWPPSKVDPDRTRINAFRKIVMGHHTVKILEDVNQLEYEVAEALLEAKERIDKKRAKTQEGRGKLSGYFPLILPYLNNRSTQQEELEAFLCECESTLHQKPLVAIIHGNDDECPETFIETLQRAVLPDLLCLNPDRNSISKQLISWPSPDSRMHQRINLLKSQLIRSQTMKPDGTVDDLIQALNLRLTPLMIQSTILVDEWQKHQPELIAQWLDFWNHLPDLAVGKKVLIFLCFKYRNIAKLSSNYTEATKYQTLNAQMRDYINQLAKAIRRQYENINGIVLSELDKIKYHELNEWLFKYAAVYCDAEVLRSEIEEFYLQQKMSAICMSALAKKLFDCLNKQLKPGV